MASNHGAVATEAPPNSHQVIPETKTSSPTLHSEDLSRHPKRQREPDSTSPRSQTTYHTDLLGSPTKSARLALATAQSPLALTGAAALQDERRRREEEQASSPLATSENPSHKALSSLMSGGEQTTSRASDAPHFAPTATMEAATLKNPGVLSIPTNGDSRPEDRGETSPQSVTSIGGVQVTESPTPMDVDSKVNHAPIQHIATQEERGQPGSLSYPGSLQATVNPIEASSRGMSYPMPSQQVQGSPPSANAKKHKCPYCNTEFTRHHNLKSHLLTHSQEKPYVCTDCQMRFRRLHDLKRHGKLHSGEKPHVCPKCDRKFARGDALARHSKGAGGCAGRRSSMGSFVDGDELDSGVIEGDESTMSGLAYDDGDEEDLRRQSLPSINTQHVPSTQNDGFSAHSRTYPPAGPRQNSSGLYPPNVGQTQPSTNTSPSVPNSMGSTHTPNTSVSSALAGTGSTGLYSQTGMTESPKPLSPGVPSHESSGIVRQRSPSLSQQLQQQQMGRRQPEIQPSHGGQPRPKLPGLSHPGFAAPSTTAFSHGRVSSVAQPSSDSGNMFAQSDPSVWVYVQSLEEKIKSLSDKVVSLDQEVASLKRQLDVRDGVATA